MDLGGCVIRSRLSYRRKCSNSQSSDDELDVMHIYLAEDGDTALKVTKGTPQNRRLEVADKEMESNHLSRWDIRAIGSLTMA